MQTASLPRSPRRPLHPLTIPTLLVGGAVAAVGWWAGAAAVLILSLPVVGALSGGIATPRGLCVGAIVIVLGMTLIPLDPGELPTLELWTLAGLVGTGMVAGWQIEAHAPRTARLGSARGTWMSVVVETGCPPDASAGLAEPLPWPPLDDPERRSLHRRKDRRRALEAAGKG